jgi:hypothetical protein
MDTNFCLWVTDCPEDAVFLKIEGPVTAETVGAAYSALVGGEHEFKPLGWDLPYGALAFRLRNLDDGLEFVAIVADQETVNDDCLCAYIDDAVEKLK